MTNHQKLYRDYYGYCNDDVVLCEVCGAQAVDIHHIVYKSQGGKDEIDNLIGMCRQCHYKAHNSLFDREFLQEIHNKNI